MKKREKKEKPAKSGKKKILYIFLAVIFVVFVVPFLVMGSGEKTNEPAEETATPETESPALPVQFGEITSVGPLGENSEMIVMSLNESVSEENKVRAVYVNAVDYLFTYGSEDLAELSVFGFDAEGDEVITVVFTAELVAALRDIEKDGDWGTEGIAAWFWFNADAYNILVESATIIEE